MLGLIAQGDPYGGVGIRRHHFEVLGHRALPSQLAYS
jgi:hypothetical protein